MILGIITIATQPRNVMFILQ